MSDVATTDDDVTEQRTETMFPGSPKQWIAAIVSGLMLLTGGGAAGSFFETSSSAKTWRAEHERQVDDRFQYIERGMADLRCVTVYKGDVVSECQCKTADLGLVNLCPKH